MNRAGDDLAEWKIHTVRQNYEYWKRFEGRDVALFMWEGTPYRSKQKVFCVKLIKSVQRIIKSEVADFWLSLEDKNPIPLDIIAKNDGFKNNADFINWFWDYPYGEMAILQFTDFRY